MNRIIVVLIICIIISSNSIDIVSSITCRRDKRIFPAGGDVEVKWWLSIKVRGFSDIYLYYDSLMESSGATTFKTGYFLRNFESGLGLTLNQLDELEHYWMVWNDQPPNILKKVGAHEKGIIAWDQDNTHGDKGFLLHHSMPEFPNILVGDEGDGRRWVSKKRFPKAYREPDELYPLDDSYAMAFPYYGWEDNIFHNNLMTYTGKYQKCLTEYNSESRSKETCRISIANFVPKITPKRLAGTIQMSRLLGSDVNPLASLMEGGKASQHMYCVTIDDVHAAAQDCAGNNDDGSGDNWDSDADGTYTNIIRLLRFIALGADNGLVTMLANIEGANIKHLIGKQTTRNTADYHKKCFKFNPTMNFYLMVSDESQVDVVNPKQRYTQYCDIWNILEDPACNENNIGERPCIGSVAANRMYVSTWRKSERADNSLATRGTQIEIPNLKTVVKIDKKEQTMHWGSTGTGLSAKKKTKALGVQTEHSKLGWRRNGAGTYWDVCISGGNIETHVVGKTDYDPSTAIMICHQAPNLRRAFMSLVVAQDTRNADVKDMLFEYKEHYDSASENVNAYANTIMNLKVVAGDSDDPQHVRAKRVVTLKRERNQDAAEFKTGLAMTLINMLMEPRGRHVEPYASSSSSSVDSEDEAEDSDDDEVEEKKGKGKGSSSSSGGDEDSDESSTDTTTKRAPPKTLAKKSAKHIHKKSRK